MPRFLLLVCSVLASILILVPSAPAAAQVELAGPTSLVIAPVPRSDAHAASLVQALAHANIAVVYSTGAFQRAQQVAQELGVEHRPYDFDPLHKDEFAGWLLANLLPATANRAIVVIAPASVIPHILERAAAIDADEHRRIVADDLLTLTLAPSYVSLVRSKLDLSALGQ